MDLTRVFEDYVPLMAAPGRLLDFSSIKANLPEVHLTARAAIAALFLVT